jgi:hydrogenase nickel incorporation protein HypB
MVAATGLATLYSLRHTRAAAIGSLLPQEVVAETDPEVQISFLARAVCGGLAPHLSFGRAGCGVEEGTMHDVRFSGEDILARQLELAEANHALFSEKEIRAISVMGAIGSGKTTLIERMLGRLKAAGWSAATIAADSAGDDDHQRFLACGVRSVNVNTQDDCHLDAHTVSHALASLPMDDLDVLFIENVGNLICPADFPLGTDTELVVISVTEGDDMVRKHPKIFAQTDVVAVNKIDLASAVGVDPRRIAADYRAINPHGAILETDARHEGGIDELLKALGLPCTSTPLSQS